MIANRSGTLWGISVGPGDPELLTLKGLRILQSVPLVACPQSRMGQRGMAYQIIQRYLTPTQQILCLRLPFVTEAEILQTAWAEAIEQLWLRLAQGQDIAFVCEGDVGLYSTFTHLARTLHQHHPQVPIQAIPGVCSPLAAVAARGEPLSIGSDRIAILPAMYSLAELEQVCEWADVVVLMKVASVFPEVYRWLDQRDLLGSAYVAAWVSSDQQRLWTDLTALKDHRLPYFSLLILHLPDSVKIPAQQQGPNPEWI